MGLAGLAAARAGSGPLIQGRASEAQRHRGCGAGASRSPWRSFLLFEGFQISDFEGLPERDCISEKGGPPACPKFRAPQARPCAAVCEARLWEAPPPLLPRLLPPQSSFKKKSLPRSWRHEGDTKVVTESANKYDPPTTPAMLLKVSAKTSL